MNDSDIDQEIVKMQKAKLEVEDQGHPADYVGENISKEQDGTYKFTQPSLTGSIIEQAGLGDRAATKKIPMNAQNLLHHHPYSIDHDEDVFKYRYVTAASKTWGGTQYSVLYGPAPPYLPTMYPYVSLIEKTGHLPIFR